MKKFSTKFLALAIVVIMLAALIPTFAVSAANLMLQEGVETYGSSQWSDGFAPDRATDGASTGTRWAPDRDDFEPHMYVTFPQVETVSAARLVVFRSSATDGGTTRIAHLQFYYSATEEGDNWTRIMEVIDPTGYVVGDEETNHELFTFPAPVNARRLRFNIVSWMPGNTQGLEEPPGQHSGVQPSIWAFEAFASVATFADVQGRIAAMEGLATTVAQTGSVFRGMFDSSLEALREVEDGDIATATIAFNESTRVYESAKAFTELRAELEDLFEEAMEEFGDDPARFAGTDIPTAVVNSYISAIDSAVRELNNNNPFDMPTYIERLQDALEEMREAAEGVDLPDQEPDVVNDVVNDENDENDNDENDEPSDFPFVIVGIAGGVLLLVIIVAVVFMSKKKKAE